MKTYSSYTCQQCGYKTSSFLGKCPNCGEWNTLVESTESAISEEQETKSFRLDESLFKLSEVKGQKVARIHSGFSELDRVLGGGIVPGSIVLVSGDPGIGKSTLLLQSAMRIAGGVRSRAQGSKKQKPGARETKSENSVLYITGEESSEQVKLRADRIGKVPDNLYIMATTAAEAIVAACNKVKPALMIVDSIQTMTTDKLSGSAGSIGQVREVSQILQRLAKSTHTPIFIVGHVTKEGSIAGPKVLEHLVDAVCHMEGDGLHAFRLLRSLKNRFGSTFEVGVFEMQDVGMVEVTNPSQIFLNERLSVRVGSVVCATIAGGRPLLVEVQALTNTTAFGIPTRRVTGLDFNRVMVVIASLAKSCSLSLGNLDIYVNVAGGLKITEPAADLAVAIAIFSAVINKPVPDKVCAWGEVGLLGELREVGGGKNRASEAKRLGFSDFITAAKFKTLEGAVKYTLGGKK